MAVLAAAAAQRGPASLPERLEAYIASSVKLTAAQRGQLLAGQPITQILDADPSREVAIFGAVWINAPAARYIAALRDIEQFEKGENFLATKRISSPPRLDDFDALRLPPDDIADLKTCRVGNCELKLGETALTQHPAGDRLVEARRPARTPSGRSGRWPSTTSTGTSKAETPGSPRIATGSVRRSWVRSSRKWPGACRS